MLLFLVFNFLPSAIFPVKYNNSVDAAVVVLAIFSCLPLPLVVELDDASKQ